MVAEYKVIYSFDKETGHVCAEIPTLNHLSDYGKDFEEAERNISKAVELYLSHLLEKKQQVPKEHARKGTFIRLQLSPTLVK
jgi:predicted RNase H-like HicB family nuclease